MKSRNKQLIDRLNEYNDVLYSLVRKGVKERRFSTELMTKRGWNLTDFRNLNAGIRWGVTSDEQIVPSWEKAAWSVWKELSESTLYKELLREIVDICKNQDIESDKIDDWFYLPDADDWLQSYSKRIANSIFLCEGETRIDFNKYFESFMADINDEEQRYVALVLLKGIKIEPRSIRLDKNTRISRPTKKEFKEILSLATSIDDPIFSAQPGAILRISMLHNSAFAIHYEIERCVNILRLFRVGAVEDIKYRIYSNSFMKNFQDEGRRRFLSNYTYIVNKNDTEIIQRFWRNFTNIHLPDISHLSSEEKHYVLNVKGTSDDGKRDILAQKAHPELVKAFSSYRDSLDSGIVEKRIAMAVMGLEALYLSPEEQQELSYRLQMRVGKVLRLIGYNIADVIETIRDAYRIRSIYIHGGLLSENNMKKARKKHGDIEYLANKIIDYLRASIVAWFGVPSKTNFIQLIDRSLLDTKKDYEVKKNMFSPY